MSESTGFDFSRTIPLLKRTKLDKQFALKADGKNTTTYIPEVRVIAHLADNQAQSTPTAETVS